MPNIETTYQNMLPHERWLLLGKITDLCIYNPSFLNEMIERVGLAEEINAIKSKFFLERQVDQLTDNYYK